MYVVCINVCVCIHIYIYDLKLVRNYHQRYIHHHHQSHPPPPPKINSNHQPKKTGSRRQQVHAPAVRGRLKQQPGREGGSKYTHTFIRSFVCSFKGERGEGRGRGLISRLSFCFFFFCPLSLSLLCTNDWAGEKTQKKEDTCIADGTDKWGKAKRAALWGRDYSFGSRLWEGRKGVFMYYL